MCTSTFKKYCIHFCSIWCTIFALFIVYHFVYGVVRKTIIKVLIIKVLNFKTVQVLEIFFWSTSWLFYSKFSNFVQYSNVLFCAQYCNFCDILVCRWRLAVLVIVDRSSGAPIEKVAIVCRIAAASAACLAHVWQGSSSTNVGKELLSGSALPLAVFAAAI